MPNKESKALFLRLLSYLRPHYKVIIFTWCLSVCVLLAQASAIWVGSEFIEKLLLGEYRGGAGVGAYYFEKLASYLLLREDDYESLLLALVFVATCGILIAAIRVLKILLLATINQDELFRIRNQLFQKLTRQNIIFSQRHLYGETSSVFINDVNQLNYAFVDLIDRSFMQPLRLMLGLFLMSTVSWKITLITVLCLVPGSLLIHVSGVHIQRLVTTVLEKVAELQGRLTEYLAVVALSRSLGTEQRESEHFLDKASKLRSAQRSLMLMDAIAPQVVTIISILAASVLTMVGGWEVLISNSMHGGELIKLALLLPMVTYPVEALASLYVSLRTSFAAAGRIFSLMDDVAYEDQKSANRRKLSFDSSIELHDVEYVLEGKRILSEVSIEFRKGNSYLVLGPSGAGKSSLLGLIAKFSAPQSGSILVDGEDIQLLDNNSWRQRLGIVAQDSILINTTVKQNLLYARPGASDKELYEVLQTVGLNSLGESIDSALGREVGNRGEFLSGGERQRFSIARALLTSPDILLIDEPTANLDPDNGKSIIELLKEIKTDRTLIIVSHDSALEKIADIEVHLKDGKIAQIISKQKPVRGVGSSWS